MRGFRSSRPTRSHSRRKMTWEALQINADGMGSGSKASAYVILPSETETEFVSPTLIATRLVSAERITTLVPAGGFAFGIGLIRWSDVNDTVPAIGDTPGPLSNADFDWIIRQVSFFPATTPVGYSITSLDSLSYLSKAKRKLSRSTGLLLVMETTGAGGLNASADVRCLVQQG